MTVKRYHWLLVTLHWMIALILVPMIVGGYFVIAQTPNTDPFKIEMLKYHMAIGMGILAVVVVRLIVRLATTHPPDAGGPLGSLTHWTMYAILVLMPLTGFATALLAGLPEIVFANSGDPLPPTFLVYPTRIAHGLLGFVLIALIALHLVGAIRHRVIGRMGFGKRR